MKNFKLLLVLSLASASFFFSSCDKEDSDPQVVTIADTIVVTQTDTIVLDQIEGISASGTFETVTDINDANLVIEIRPDYLDNEVWISAYSHSIYFNNKLEYFHECVKELETPTPARLAAGNSGTTSLYYNMEGVVVITVITDIVEGYESQGEGVYHYQEVNTYTVPEDYTLILEEEKPVLRPFGYVEPEMGF